MSHDFALPLILIFSVGSLFVAGYLISWVLKRDTGTPAMREISNAIKEGAEAFLKRQNTTIARRLMGTPHEFRHSSRLSRYRTCRRSGSETPG